jgi:CheY-like chemotaxis protein
MRNAAAVQDNVMSGSSDLLCPVRIAGYLFKATEGEAWSSQGWPLIFWACSMNKVVLYSAFFMKTKRRNTRYEETPLPQCSVGKLSACNKGQTWTEPKAKVRSACKPKKRILVVDDDPQSLELYSALLSEAGYRVDQADHALALVRKPRASALGSEE